MKISDNRLSIQAEKKVKKSPDTKKDITHGDAFTPGSGKADNLGDELKKLSLLKENQETERLYEMGESVSGGTMTGDIRIHRNFHSHILDNDRDVMVYLPPGYHDPKNKDKKYGVAYLQDGHNMFDARTASFGEWEIDETTERLIREGKIESIIMVAIPPVDRMYEYTPVAHAIHGGGGLDKYDDFLNKELKPFIDKVYKTIPEHSGMIGSSLGGISTFDVTWKHGDKFDRSAPMSPSLWFADKYMIEKLKNDPKTKGPEKIWLSMGKEETPIKEQIPDKWLAITEDSLKALPDNIDKSKLTPLLNKELDEGELNYALAKSGFKNKEERAEILSHSDKRSTYDKIKDKLSPHKVNIFMSLMNTEDNQRGGIDKDKFIWMLKSYGFDDREVKVALDNSLLINDDNRNNIPDGLDNSREFGELLLDKGYKLGETLFYHEEPGAGHNEMAWRQTIHKALLFLYGTDK